MLCWKAEQHLPLFSESVLLDLGNFKKWWTPIHRVLQQAPRKPALNWPALLSHQRRCCQISLLSAEKGRSPVLCAVSWLSLAGHLPSDEQFLYWICSPCSVQKNELFCCFPFTGMSHLPPLACYLKNKIGKRKKKGGGNSRAFQKAKEDFTNRGSNSDWVLVLQFHIEMVELVWLLQATFREREGRCNKHLIEVCMK